MTNGWPKGPRSGPINPQIGDVLVGGIHDSCTAVIAGNICQKISMVLPRSSRHDNVVPYIQRHGSCNVLGPTLVIDRLITSAPSPPLLCGG